ncbi:MAG: sulfotransferase [Cyanobacteria bacterium P01_F01_bin.150]
MESLLAGSNRIRLLSNQENRKLIFILGITTRSGTNFLSDLICLHPNCISARPSEVNFLVHSNYLDNFVEKLGQAWQSHSWGRKFLSSMEELNVDPSAALYRNLGHGLESFLWQMSLTQAREEDIPEPKCLVCKKPSVKNLENIFSLFPNAKIILIIRYGRSVVESQTKSFGRSFEGSVRSWNRAAQTISRSSLEKYSDSYLIVKYETLFESTKSEMEKVLNFIGLDASEYDFSKAENLPFRGSSQTKQKGKEISWQKQSRSEVEFSPLERWSSWSRYKHERFNWIAGKNQKKLGYKLKEYTLWNKGLWIAINLILDFAIRPTIVLYRRLSH